jgi:hypothetical protein
LAGRRRRKGFAKGKPKRISYFFASSAKPLRPLRPEARPPETEAYLMPVKRTWPDAEGAKVSQRTQKIKNLFGITSAKPLRPLRPVVRSPATQTETYLMPVKRTWPDAEGAEVSQKTQK